ncbi:MAG: ShlB/FhaC/HecB family hemolysin secretion/activation protein [Gammaproteobacteria bacterium]
MMNSARGAAGRLRVAAALLVSLSASGPLAAQAGLTREEVLRLPPPLRAAASDFGAVQCDATPVVGLLPGETALAEVKLVEAEGMTVVPAADLQRLSSALPDNPVSREGLARLVAAMECRYRELGYVFARVAVVGDPVAAPGRYRVVVHEGVVDRVEVLADDQSLADLALRAFGSVERGKPLNAGAVRRGLAHAASVGLTSIRPTVRRSRIDPMSIDLVLVVEAPPGQVFAQAHNGNADTLGPWGVLVGARTSGLTPLQESTTLGLYSAIEPRKQFSAQFDTQALLGDGGLKGRLGAAWSRARPGEELEPLEIESKTGFLVAELSAPLQVRRGLVTFWRAGIEALEQETTFFGGVPLGDDSLRVAFLGTRTDGLLRSGAWSFDLQARRGLDALGAMRPGDPDASRADADPQAFLLRAETESTLQLARALSLRARIKGQWTDQRLAAFESFSYGGIVGGQGFDPGALTGDSGVSVELQLLGPLFSVGERVALRPFVSASAARVWTTGDSGAAFGRAQAAVVGLQLALGRSLQIEATYAEPFGAIEGPGPDAYGPRALVSLTYSFVPGARR